MKEVLPIGTIVLLKEATKKVLIVGYLPQEKDAEKIYDYSGVPFPEGLIDSRQLLLFNQDRILQICHKSFYDDEVNTFLDKVKKIKGEM